MDNSLVRLPQGGLIPCPQCPRGWSTEQALAVHLMDAHGLAAPAAAERARDALRDAAKVQRREAKAGMRLCPRCLKFQGTVGDLAVHLTKAHDVEAMAAVAEARALIEPPREEPEMPCGECGKPGHNALTCATIGKAPSEKKPATGGGARRKKPKPTTTTKATRAAAKARTPRRTVATRSPPFVPR